MMMDSSCKIISLALLSLLVLASAGPAILRDGEDTRKTCTNDDSSQCEGWQICCDGECTDISDGCLGVSGDALWGIGIAAAVASIAVPVICCCCCCGAIFWFLRRRSQRQG